MIVITSGLNAPTAVTADEDDIESLPDIARMPKRSRRRFVPIALIDERRHTAVYLGWLVQLPRHGKPIARTWVKFSVGLAAFTQPDPLPLGLRGKGRRRGRR